MPSILARPRLACLTPAWRNCPSKKQKIKKEIHAITSAWKTLFLCGLLCAAVEGHTAQENSPVELLEDSRRILFLGDSITYAGSYITYFDAWLTRAYSGREYEVLNLGLPSETVSGLSEEGHADGTFPRPDLHERLDRVLSASKPDLVIACYGINCGIYQPLDDERFQAYKDGIERLRTAVLEQGGAIVFMTPPTYDSHGAEEEVNYDAVLSVYSQWLLSRRDDGWLVVDLHAQMVEEIRKRREEDPTFTFQPDRIHPNNEGHAFMARQLITYFGEASDTGMPASEDPILGAVQQRMSVLRDAWLTHTRHNRPGISEGLPLPEAQKKAAQISETIATKERKKDRGK